MQLEAILKSTWSFKNGDLSGFDFFLHAVIGFFIVESVVVNTTTSNFRSSHKADMLWDYAVSRVDELISNNLHEFDQALFNGIKTNIILFMHTLEGYRYSATRLSDLLVSLFDRYSNLLKGECDKKVAAAIEKDEYAPLIVASRKELEKINASFALESELMKCNRFVIFIRLTIVSRCS
jgi:hypothetical protein